MANSTETHPNLVTATGWADDEISEHYASEALVGGLLDLDDIASHLEDIAPFAIDVSVIVRGGRLKVVRNEPAAAINLMGYQGEISGPVAALIEAVRNAVTEFRSLGFRPAEIEDLVQAIAAGRIENIEVDDDEIRLELALAA